MCKTSTLGIVNFLATLLNCATIHMGMPSVILKRIASLPGPPSQQAEVIALNLSGADIVSWCMVLGTTYNYRLNVWQPIFIELLNAV